MTDIPRTYSAKGERPMYQLRGEQAPGAAFTVPYSSTAIALLSGPGLSSIIGERIEQVDVHGFTPEHDLGHHPGELALAAASYLNFAVDQLHGHGDDGKRPDPATWPWQREAWRPGDARANLVKAVAIAWAAIDRLDGEPAQDGEARAA